VVDFQNLNNEENGVVVSVNTNVLEIPCSNHDWHTCYPNIFHNVRTSLQNSARTVASLHYDMIACFQILSSSLYTNHPTIDGIALTNSQQYNITSKGNDYGYLYFYKLKKVHESLCLINPYPANVENTVSS
jgi:hypothetical protein